MATARAPVSQRGVRQVFGAGFLSQPWGGHTSGAVGRPHPAPRTATPVKPSFWLAAAGSVWLALLATAAWGTASLALDQSPATFLVGADAEEITPSAALIATNQLHLGGYGLGTTGDRHATGVMGGPGGLLGRVYVRALAVSDGKRAIALGDLDNQGAFAAYKDNVSTGAHRAGFDDIRSALGHDPDIALAFDDITISSDHSHAGQDLTGAWGLVPDAYFDFVKQQAVKAFKTAYQRMQPATLKEGAVPVPPCDSNVAILNNQFCGDTGPGSVMDYELRAMQAVSTTSGSVIATVLNFAAHATVMGSGNTLISPDWPGVVAKYMEQKYGGVGITIVADVGRSQPANRGCTKAELANPTSFGYDVDRTNASELGDSCALSKYARRVMGYVDAAVAKETPICKGGIDGRETFIHDSADNVGLLVLNNAGELVQAPIARSTQPPYLTANAIGTWVGAFRIGDLVITVNPGEAYPNIRQQFMDNVPGARRYWTTGLSNDQLGYLTAPASVDAQQQVIVHGAQGNDNFLFNVGIGLGDHVMCVQVSEARAMGMAASAPQACAALTLADVIPYAGPAAVDRGASPKYPAASAFSHQPESCGSFAAQGLVGYPNTAAGNVPRLLAWLPGLLLVGVLIRLAPELTRRR